MRDASYQRAQAMKSSVPSNLGHRRSRKSLTVVIILLVCFAIVLGAFAHYQITHAIDVTVNGHQVTVYGDRTVESAVNQSGASFHAGNFVDIKGGVLREGGGNPFTLTVDGEASDNLKQRIAEGAEITIADGTDITEETTTDTNYTIHPKKVEQGSGPLSKVTVEGSDGTGIAQIGKTSGKAKVTHVTKKAIDRVYTHYYPRVGSDKVICLTFDDGPYTASDQTGDILDLLKKYKAKATFFTVGQDLTQDKGRQLVNRELDEGHQVCTHTWNHAGGSGQGVSLAYMTKAEQRDEVIQGQQAIKDATGKDPSKVLRAPGGNFPFSVWKNVDDLITAEVNWTIDTQDWSQPGTDYIYSQLKKAKPGDIILMHDGGGDRSQTIAALKKIFPKWKKKGYRFITVDQMLQYTAQ